jgi:acetyltransferase
MESHSDYRWKSDLKCLFHPESAVLIGASENSSMARQIFRDVKLGGFSGKIFPVHPRNPTFLGERCYSQVREIEVPVDCALFSVPSPLVPGILKDCGEKGIRSAVVFSSGFAEAGDEGKKLDNLLRELAETYQIRLCGPNCFGLVSLRGGFAPYLKGLPAPREPGGAAILSESGGLSYALFQLACDRGLGLSYVISTGNETVLQLADYLEYLIEDESTKIVLLVLESIRDVKRFRALARRAVQKKKPLLAFKLGRSEKGRLATLSHTGTLATTVKVYQALFRQHGIVEVDDLDELIETAILFLSEKRPRGKGVGMIATSGGRGMLLADLSEEVGLELPEFSSATKDALKRVMPHYSSIANPIDLTGQATEDLELHRKCLQVLAQEERVSTLVFCRETPRHEGMVGLQKRLLQLYETAQSTEKLIIALSVISENINDYGLEFRKTCRLPFLQDARRALKAIRSLFCYAEFCSKQDEDASKESEVSVEGSSLIDKLNCVPHRVLNEAESKGILAELGICTPRRIVCALEEEFTKNTTSGLKFPVALKIISRDLPHKAKLGGVRLSIRNIDELIAARKSILFQVQLAAPRTVGEGFIIEEMISNGLELILGMSCDPQFGPVIVLGLGGTDVEDRKSQALRLPPLQRRDIFEMFGECQLERALEPLMPNTVRRDILKVLCDVVMRFSYGVQHLATVVNEIDVNPLIVHPSGVTAVDALIVLKE